MNKRIKRLYIATNKGLVVAYDSNLKDFIKKFNKLESESKNYDHYFNEFKKLEGIPRVIQYNNTTNDIYILQRVR